jgi:hypothetical protein
MSSYASGRGSAAVTAMSLTMRPTGLSSGFYETVDYSVFCGEWCIGHIHLGAVVLKVVA